MEIIERGTMAAPKESYAGNSLIGDFCIPFLLGTQNQNGGWGYYSDSESRVEPTCWALRALSNVNAPGHVSPDCLNNARKYLLEEQLGDGSWPAAPEETSGSWVTSLACSLLSQDRESEKSVKAGLKWLCDDYPRDSSPLRRFIGRLRATPAKTEIDDSVRGWGWTPRTASWVEPSSFALMALRDSPAEWRPAESAQRRELATALLYDRMCPKGGWNCGNPMVYGVAGEPLVLPTGWALLALRDQPAHEKKSKSLAWLCAEFESIRSAASLSIARIALEAYGVALPGTDHKLQMLFDARDFLRTTESVSWSCLALSPKRCWFPPAERAA
jgi:hypothetical protein